MKQEAEGRYASVNGLKIYYEIHGAGRPLVLLHGGIALQIAIRHPDLVRKLMVAAPAYSREGSHPGFFDQIEALKPDDLAGSPWQVAYERTAPKPEQWPTLVIVGDSDVVRPEHAVQLFRLLGGGVAGDDAAGRPHLQPSQLAVLPGTTHVTLVDRADWLLSMIGEFLDAPTTEPPHGERRAA